MNEIQKFDFNQQEVDFDLTTNQNLMVNATQMAKIFGKEVARFMENEGTKMFISSCLNTRNSSFLNLKNEDDLFTSKQKSGTWMHRILALKFAAWLNPDFEVWVYSTIDEILFGRYKKMEQSIKESAARKDRLDILWSEIKATDRFKEAIQLEKEETKAVKFRKKEISNQLDLFRNKSLEVEN